jgi:multiple sugar transport system permease protein
MRDTARGNPPTAAEANGGADAAGLALAARPGLGRLPGTAGRRKPAGTRRPRRILTPAVFVVPVVLYALFFYAWPLAYGIMISFQRYDFSAVVRGYGPFIGFSNYAAALSNPVTMTALRNTVIFTVASLAGQLGLGMAIAILFNQRFFLSGFLRRFVVLPWLVPSVASATIFSLLFSSINGPINNFLRGLHLIHSQIPWLYQANWAITAIILVNIWGGLPFIILVFYSGLQDIDPAVLEAAMVDGAGAWQKLRRITLPMMRPVILIVLMLSIIGTVKVFDSVWLLTGGGPNNSTQLLSSWAYTQAFQNFNFGQGAAIGNLLLLISFVLALFYLRTLRASNSR